MDVTTSWCSNWSIWTLLLAHWNVHRATFGSCVSLSSKASLIHISSRKAHFSWEPRWALCSSGSCIPWPAPACNYSYSYMDHSLSCFRGWRHHFCSIVTDFCGTLPHDLNPSSDKQFVAADHRSACQTPWTYSHFEWILVRTISGSSAIPPFR